jgi:DNA end-binding protein Ku
MLLLETLHYPDEIRERELSLPNVPVNERELAVAGTLVDALEEDFDPSKYKDHYREALLKLIEAKTQGREVVVPEGEAPGAPVTDLMAALRASIEAARGRKAGGAEPAAKPTRAERGGHERRKAAKPRARKKAAA